MKIHEFRTLCATLCDGAVVRVRSRLPSLRAATHTKLLAALLGCFCASVLLLLLLLLQPCVRRGFLLTTHTHTRHIIVASPSIDSTSARVLLFNRSSVTQSNSECLPKVHASAKTAGSPKVVEFRASSLRWRVFGLKQRVVHLCVRVCVLLLLTTTTTKRRRPRVEISSIHTHTLTYTYRMCMHMCTSGWSL